MTTGEKIIVGTASMLIAGIIVYLIGISAGWWKNPFAKPAPEKTDFEKCEEANKAKPDGEPCSNCVPEGSGQPNFNGVIKDGKCEMKAQPAPAPVMMRYIVSNQSGATIYTLQGTNYVAPRIPNKVPYGTEIKIISVSADRRYVNTTFGWLSINDIGRI